MTYEIHLLSTLRPPGVDGAVTVALNHGGIQAASVELSWNQERFTAQFNGCGKDMPEPGHPAEFIQGVVDVLNNARVCADEPFESTFGRGPLSLDITARRKEVAK